MIDLNHLSTLPLFSNSLLDWLIAGAVGVAVLIVLISARRMIRGHHRKMQATAQVELLEIPFFVLSRTTSLFFLVLAAFTAFQTLMSGSTSQKIAVSALTIVMFWQVGVWASAAASAWLDIKRRNSMTSDRAAVGSLSVIGFIMKVLIWALVLMLILENLGVDITALVAGLGIGGIAVALAVQNVLGDLFASLSITLDRPFVVGDFLIVDDFLGSVEYIGIKSTRLRSLSGEQIVMSNSDLLSSRVRNYGRMNERRVVFANRVTYQTPIDVVERIPGVIRDIIESRSDTRFDRSHFQKHGLSALEFETVYYVLSPDYNKYMDIQQAINLRIHRAFAEMGVEFAYPTQRLLVASLDQPGEGPSGEGEPRQRAA